MAHTYNGTFVPILGTVHHNKSCRPYPQANQNQKGNNDAFVNDHLPSAPVEKPHHLGSAFYKKGVVALLQGEYREAVKYMSSALRCGDAPVQAKAYADRSAAFWFLWQYEDCIKDMKMAWACGTKRDSLTGGLCMYEHDVQEYPKTLAHILQERLARCHMCLGRYEMAKFHFANAFHGLQSNPENLEKDNKDAQELLQLLEELSSNLADEAKGKEGKNKLPWANLDFPTLKDHLVSLAQKMVARDQEPIGDIHAMNFEQNQMRLAERERRHTCWNLFRLLNRAAVVPSLQSQALCKRFNPGVEFPPLSEDLEIKPRRRNQPTDQEFCDIVTKRKLVPGQIILREEPFASMVHPQFASSYCHHCLKYIEAIVPCPKCPMMQYCTWDCRIEASAYHQYECGYLETLNEPIPGKAYSMLLIYRVITRTGLRNILKFLKLQKESRMNPNGDPGFEMNDQVRNFAWLYNQPCPPSPAPTNCLILTANFMLLYLCKAQFFKNVMDIPEIDATSEIGVWTEKYGPDFTLVQTYIGSLLLRFMTSLCVRTITETETVCADGEIMPTTANTLGFGVYPLLYTLQPRRTVPLHFAFTSNGCELRVAHNTQSGCIIFSECPTDRDIGFQYSGTPASGLLLDTPATQEIKDWPRQSERYRCLDCSTALTDYQVIEANDTQYVEPTQIQPTPRQSDMSEVRKFNNWEGAGDLDASRRIYIDFLEEAVEQFTEALVGGLWHNFDPICDAVESGLLDPGHAQTYFTFLETQIIQLRQLWEPILRIRGAQDMSYQRKVMQHFSVGEALCPEEQLGIAERIARRFMHGMLIYINYITYGHKATTEGISSLPLCMRRSAITLKVLVQKHTKTIEEGMQECVKELSIDVMEKSVETFRELLQTTAQALTEEMQKNAKTVVKNLRKPSLAPSTGSPVASPTMTPTSAVFVQLKSQTVADSAKSPAIPDGKSPAVPGESRSTETEPSKAAASGNEKPKTTTSSHKAIEEHISGSSDHSGGSEQPKSEEATSTGSPASETTASQEKSESAGIIPDQAKLESKEEAAKSTEASSETGKSPEGGPAVRDTLPTMESDENANEKKRALATEAAAGASAGASQSSSSVCPKPADSTESEDGDRFMSMVIAVMRYLVLEEHSRGERQKLHKVTLRRLLRAKAKLAGMTTDEFLAASLVRMYRSENSEGYRQMADEVITMAVEEEDEQEDTEDTRVEESKVASDDDNNRENPKYMAKSIQKSSDEVARMFRVARRHVGLARLLAEHLSKMVGSAGLRVTCGTPKEAETADSEGATGAQTGRSATPTGAAASQSAGNAESRGAASFAGKGAVQAQSGGVTQNSGAAEAKSSSNRSSQPADAADFPGKAAAQNVVFAVIRILYKIPRFEAGASTFVNSIKEYVIDCRDTCKKTRDGSVMLSIRTKSAELAAKHHLALLKDMVWQAERVSRDMRPIVRSIFNRDSNIKMATCQKCGKQYWMDLIELKIEDGYKIPSQTTSLSDEVFAHADLMLRLSTAWPHHNRCIQRIERDFGAGHVFHPGSLEDCPMLGKHPK